MPRSQGILSGSVNSNIRTVVAKGFISGFHTVLVTSIDSTTDIAGSVIGKRIVTIEPGCAFLGAGVTMPGEEIVRINATLDLFNGFDEVWCFEKPPAIPKPDDDWIVSPSSVETPSASLISWMTQADCLLGLGDGIGMNFVTRRQTIARSLKHFGVGAL